MKLNPWQEFPLIEWIRRHAGQPGPGDCLGIGDDASCHAPEPGKHEIITADALVEGVHWDFKWCDPFSLGLKSAAVNLSDIAAMGGSPRRAYLALALPAAVPALLVQQFLKGFLKGLKNGGAWLAGGDTVASPGPWLISVTLQGVVARKEMIRRRGARPGDLILTTGELGGAAAGLALLKQGKKPMGWEQAAQRLLTPEPRLAEGRLLAATRKVSAMLDLSDGLAGDLRRLTESSQVGAQVFAGNVPVSLATRSVAQALRRDPLDWVLTGGEDYELLFTAAPRHAAGLIELLGADPLHRPASIIGEILPARKGLTVLMPDGRSQPLPRGWEHGR
jgi:thiamine-monophosphate kinase